MRSCCIDSSFDTKSSLECCVLFLLPSLDTLAVMSGRLWLNFRFPWLSGQLHCGVLPWPYCLLVGHLVLTLGLIGIWFGDPPFIFLCIFSQVPIKSPVRCNMYGDTGFSMWLMEFIGDLGFFIELMEFNLHQDFHSWSYPVIFLFLDVDPLLSRSLFLRAGHQTL